MYGYPRRQKARRLPPTTALFDPSGDSSCTGWWRADSNVTASNAKVLVASVRMEPYKQAGGDLRGKYTFTYGTNFYGPFTQNSDWGDRVLTPSRSLRLYGYAGGHQAWHEVMTFRRHLTDTEIL